MNGLKTLADIEREEEVLRVQLANVEADVSKLHEREWELRTALQHCQIQKERLRQLEPSQAPA